MIAPSPNTCKEHVDVPCPADVPECTELSGSTVSVHFVRPAAQSISSCTGSVPEVDLAKIELARLGTFLYPTWFGTVRHVSARFGHTPRARPPDRRGLPHTPR